MTTWIARIEWRTPDQYDEPALDLVMDHLTGHDPAIATEPTPPTDTTEQLHTYTATVTLHANTLRQATATALELVEGATGEKATGLEVLDVDTHDHRLEQPIIPDLVGYAEIADMLDVTQQRARQLADLDGFPPPAVIVRAGPLRIRTQVEAWAATWQRKVGRPRKTDAAVDATKVTRTDCAIAGTD